MVELRDAERLEADRRSTAIAREQHRSCGEAAARALPGDCDTVPIDAELVGVVVQPAQRRVAVVDRQGKRMLGREPVLDGRHHRPELPRDGDAEPMLHLDRADDEATTVDVEHRGSRRGSSARLALGRGVDAHEHVGRTRGPRNVMIGDVDARHVDLLVHRAHHVEDRRPGGIEVVESDCRQQLDDGSEFRIEVVGHEQILACSGPRAHLLSRQEENQHLSVPPEIARELPEPIQRLMGYRLGAFALGYVDDVRDPIEILRGGHTMERSFVVR